MKTTPVTNVVLGTSILAFLLGILFFCLGSNFLGILLWLIAYAVLLAGVVGKGM